MPGSDLEEGTELRKFMAMRLSGLLEQKAYFVERRDAVSVERVFRRPCGQKCKDAHTGGTSGEDACEGVFADDAMLRPGVQPPRREQVAVWCGVAVGHIFGCDGDGTSTNMGFPWRVPFDLTSRQTW